MGLGLAHYIPFLAYLACWVMCLVSLTGRPLLGFYLLVPMLPYRTLRDHFLEYPLGASIVTALLGSIILGAFFKGKRPPKTSLYAVWFLLASYLYLSLWFGVLVSDAPTPIWLHDINFVTWKDYLFIPLTFLAAGMVIDDRKTIRNVLILAALTILIIDRSALMGILSHSLLHFDESKRDGGPLGFAGSNGLAAFLAQFAMFIWGLATCIRSKKYRLLGYATVGLTLFTTMYTFSRASYIAVVVGAFLLGVIKNRKLLIVVFAFLLTWQTVVPTSVTERINMTENSHGQLESSSESRLQLWNEALEMFQSDPIFGIGYGSYQLRTHLGNLRDTHNWFVKVLVETGIVGMLISLLLLWRMLVTSLRLFRRAEDPMYQGLGLGLFLLTCCSIILNMFGERWTYLEINGLTWVLFGAAARALNLIALPTEAEPKVIEAQVAQPAYL